MSSVGLPAGHIAKYEALGNDYLVMRVSQLDAVPSTRTIEQLCHRHRGIGSDGLLVHLPSDEPSSDARLKIFNPDGSEAEKSGNGLRIFARYLADFQVARRPQVRIALGKEIFVAELLGLVPESDRRCHVDAIRMAMGTFALGAEATGFAREVPADGRLLLSLGDEHLDATLVSMGSPHCVIFGESLDKTTLRRLGPLIEHHTSFARRTNVQLVEVVGPDRLNIAIWERGAGETSASGSSSCAAAVAAWHRGLVDRDVTVDMAGGSLQVNIATDHLVTLTGPAQPVCLISPW